MTLLHRALLLLALLLPLSASAAPVEIKDDLGHTTHWAKLPQHIVSLLPSLTETVCALGGCAKLVGVDRYSNYPAHVQALPHLGGLDDINIEAIVALRPDVVLVSPSSRLTERLQSLGLTVVSLDAKTTGDVQAVLDRIGQLLGSPEAAPLWRQIQAGIDAAAQSVPPAARGLLVYYEVASGPYAAGASSFMGETLARLGERNIVPASLGPFPKLNPEFIVRANPQLIMLGQREADDIYQRPGWNQIAAIRDRRVCVFSSAEGDVLARPGPRMAEAAQVMARCLREIGSKNPS